MKPKEKFEEIKIRVYMEQKEIVEPCTIKEKENVEDWEILKKQLIRQFKEMPYVEGLFKEINIRESEE